MGFGWGSDWEVRMGFGWEVRMGGSDGVRMGFGCHPNTIRTGGCSYEVRMRFVRTKSVCSVDGEGDM